MQIQSACFRKLAEAEVFGNLANSVERSEFQAWQFALIVPNDHLGDIRDRVEQALQLGSLAELEFTLTPVLPGMVCLEVSYALDDEGECALLALARVLIYNSYIQLALYPPTWSYFDSQQLRRNLQKNR